MKKTLDFYKYVSSDITRRFMNGVYYTNGFAWATDGHVLIKIKTDYPEKFENKIVSKELAYIDGQFPNGKKVIPDLNDMIELNVSNDALLKEFKELKGILSIHKKIGEWYSFGYMLPNRSYILIQVWERILHFIECYPNAKLYAHKEDGYRLAHQKSLMLVSEDNLLVFMPSVSDVSEDTPVGYRWCFDRFSFEEHDKLDFIRILRRIGAKGIEERYSNGNLTDKDNKIIDNLYKYFEIVGYNYKREVA